MKKLISSLIVLIFGLTSFGNKPTDLAWLKDWFSAWELVSKEILSLPASEAPEMLFFDSAYVITTSVVSAPNGTPIDGPAFFGQKLKWRKAPHNGQLILPDGKKVPLGLMSFAGPAKNGKSFFVMAAPSFWQAAGVKSAELNLDRMLTGVFLHEFAHTRQFNGFGRMIDSIQSVNLFKEVELNDDIVQEYFRNDTNYIKPFKLEVSKLYEAANSSSDQKAKELIREALDMFDARQEKFFKGSKEILMELDKIFLSMEGVGQYVAVAWLVHPKGGNLPMETAVKGFRRNGRQWSQDEGLALFLALRRVAKPNWAKDMFSDRPAYITDLLIKAVE